LPEGAAAVVLDEEAPMDRSPEEGNPQARYSGQKVRRGDPEESRRLRDPADLRPEGFT